MKAPAFQFYVDNFRDGVADMEQDEIGSYMMLLCYQWSNGHIPRDRARMERAAFGPVSDHVLRKFKLCEDGEYRNERLEREREKQAAYRESRAINGAKGGRPKAHENHMVLNGKAQHKAQHKAQESSPSPSSSSISVPVPPEEPPPLDKRAHCSVSSDTSVARQIIDHLNKLTGRTFRAVDTHITLIRNRLKEPDVTVDGCKLMIERQAKLWMGTKMEEYLRPQTLFGKENFAGYYDARTAPLPSASSTPSFKAPVRLNMG